MEETRKILFNKIKQAYIDYRSVLIEGGTGVGKTKFAIDLIREKQRWLIVIPKIVLIENWKDEFKKWNKEELLVNVEFCTYAGLEKFAETGTKRNVILDEAHAVNERRLMAIKDITNRYALEGGKGKVIALSATIDEERRVLLRHLAIHPANTIKFTLDEAVEANIVADYKILVVNIPMSETVSWRQLDKWKGMKGTEADGYQALTSTYQSIKERGGDTKFATLNRLHYIYNLPSKQEAAKIVLSQLSKERKLLTFGANIKQIEALCEYTHHSKKSKTDKTFEEFCGGTIMRMGAVQTIAEGVNIPDLDTGLIVQAMSKSRHAIQRLGRAGRKEKDKEALMIILMSQDTQDSIWVKNSLAAFNQSKIYHTNIEAVKDKGIELIINNL